MIYAGRMEDNPVTDPLIIPPALLAQVQAAALEEHGSPVEVLRDAVEYHLRERRWQWVFAYGEQCAQTLGLTELDIPRSIAEYRQEHN
jgi:hypothetical protein